jgi:hypothetical protein
MSTLTAEITHYLWAATGQILKGTGSLTFYEDDILPFFLRLPEAVVIVASVK